MAFSPARRRWVCPYPSDERPLGRAQRRFGGADYGVENAVLVPNHIEDYPLTSCLVSVQTKTVVVIAQNNRLKSTKVCRRPDGPPCIVTKDLEGRSPT